MFTPDQYQLLDFGDGRRLERFGAVDAGSALSGGRAGSRGPIRPPGRRPTPASSARDGERGQWTCRRELPERWTIAMGRWCSS